MTFPTLVRETNDFHVKKAEFHTKNLIFKVEYLTKEQKEQESLMVLFKVMIKEVKNCNIVLIL